MNDVRIGTQCITVSYYILEKGNTTFLKNAGDFNTKIDFTKILINCFV